MQRRSVLVIGAGDCLDVPVAELAVIFERVVLADIVVGVEARRWNLAPIPEWSPDFHRVHEVGAWIYAG